MEKSITNHSMTSKTLKNIELDITINNSINPYAEYLALNELSDIINQDKDKEKDKKENKNKSNKNKNKIINTNQDEDSTDLDDINIKPILQEYIREEKEYLTKTMAGYIYYHSAKKDKVDLEYLLEKVSPRIGEFVNKRGKRYKVISIFLLILFYFTILFYFPFMIRSVQMWKEKLKMFYLDPMFLSFLRLMIYGIGRLIVIIIIILSNFFFR